MRNLVFALLSLICLSSCNVSMRKPDTNTELNASSKPTAQVSGCYFEELSASDQERAIRQLSWLGTTGFDDLQNAGYNYWPLRFHTETALALIVVGGRATLVPIDLTSNLEIIEPSIESAVYDNKMGESLTLQQASTLHLAGLVLRGQERYRQINLGKDVVNRYPDAFDSREHVNSEMDKLSKKAGATDFQWEADAPFLSNDLKNYHYYYFATIRGNTDPTKYDWSSITALHVFSKGFFGQNDDDMEFAATTATTWLRIKLGEFVPSDLHDLTYPPE